MITTVYLSLWNSSEWIDKIAGGMYNLCVIRKLFLFTFEVVSSSLLLKLTLRRPGLIGVSEGRRAIETHIKCLKMGFVLNFFRSFLTDSSAMAQDHFRRCLEVVKVLYLIFLAMKD